jgi:hypothetical protein
VKKNIIPSAIHKLHHEVVEGKAQTPGLARVGVVSRKT